MLLCRRVSVHALLFLTVFLNFSKLGKGFPQISGGFPQISQITQINRRARCARRGFLSMCSMCGEKNQCLRMSVPVNIQ
jgi:hypothetical protein